MTRYISLPAAALAFAVSLSVGAPAQAAGPITSLEQCYNAVITWCTETFPDHADQCGSSSGLSDCDEEFGAATQAGLGLSLAARRDGPAIPARTFRRLMAGAALVRVGR